MSKDGGPAYPSKHTRTVRHSLGNYETVEDFYPGMSLRDYFAGQALAGLLGLKEAELGQEMVRNTGKTVAEVAYIHADNMLEARNA